MGLLLDFEMIFQLFILKIYYRVTKV